MNSTNSDGPVLGHLLQANPFLPVGVALDDASRKQYDALWARLTAPFPEADIEWLLREDEVSRGADGVYYGRVFAYVNARAVQQRLDEVFGIYWSTKQIPAAFGVRSGFVCELSVFVPAVGWITKSDACDLTALEPVRGGASGALKRVAVQFGIGRYLYSLGETVVRLSETGGARRIRVDNKTLTWSNPLMPPFALPPEERPARERHLKELADRAAQEADAARKRAEVEAAEKAARAAEQERKRAEAVAKAAAEEAQARAASAKVEAAPTASTPTPEPSKPVTPQGGAEVVATGASENLAPTITPAQARFGGLSVGQLSRLNEILGPDTPLVLSVLKHRKMLPLGATSIEQLPVNNANALINNAAHVAHRMKLLTDVSKIINGRFDLATTYFVARSLVKANEPWHVAADGHLKTVLDHSEAFSRALDKMALNTQRAAA